MLKESSSRNASHLVLHDLWIGESVRAVSPNGSGTAHQTPDAGPDLPEAGPTPISLWSSVLAALVEGFGAYGAALYPTVPLQRIPSMMQQSPEPMASRSLSATGYQIDADLPSQDRNVAPFGEMVARDTGPTRRWNLLTSSYDAAVALWAYWRREREIRKAVEALEQFDERTLRDIGISSRTEIEQIVRYCHDC